MFQILYRIVKAFAVMMIISIIIFFAVRLAPGDPVMTVLGTIGSNEERIEVLREEMGLNEPLTVQYLTWIGGVLQGDFGTSLISDEPVINLIFDRLPASLELISFAILLGLILAIPIGILASAYPRKPVDRVFSVLSMTGMSVPVFWLGLILMIYLSIKWRILPASGYIAWSEDWIMHIKLLIMPAVTMGIVQAAVFFRFVRNGMLDILKEPFIETARAKGLSAFSIYVRHGFRNILLTLITVLGLEIGILISGTVIIEQVFSWTGIGWLVLNAVSTRDYTLLQGTVLFISAGVILINLVLNMLYSLLDPRIKNEVTTGKSQ